MNPETDQKFEAEVAISEALEYVYNIIAGSSNENLRDFLGHAPNDQDIKQYIIKASAEDCDANSDLVIGYLADNYPDQFERLFRLTTTADSPKHPFKDEKWIFHTYFLAQDKAGNWYAGSPANYSTGNIADEINNFRKNPSLGELLNEIQLTDGGEWPSSEFIEHIGSYEPPRRKLNEDGEAYTASETVISLKRIADGATSETVAIAAQISR